MKWTSRNAVVALLSCLSVAFAGPSIARGDPLSGPPASVRHFESVTDVSSSAGSGTSAPRSAASNGRFDLSFHTLGRSFDMELEPNDLFVDGAKTIWVDDSGVVEMEPEQIFYRGRMRGEDDSWVRLTLQGGTLEGIVWTPEETYFFEPASHFLGEPAEGTVAYRLSDTEPEWSDESCAVEADTLRHHRHRRSSASTRTARTFESLRAMLQSTAPAVGLDRLQLGIVGDWQLFQRHGGGSDTHMQTIVNLMDGVYQREINVKVEITNTVVYSTSNDPFSETSNPSSRLNEFGAYKNSNDNSPGQLLYGADLAHLFTGVDLDGSVVGIAWVGSVCETVTGAGLSQDYSSNMNTLVSLTAHEIGHNLAARHDPDVGCPSGYIMWPSVLTVSNLEDLHFSSCSKSAIAQEVAGASCMDEVVPGTPTATPTRTPTPTFTKTPTNTPLPPNGVEFVSQSVPGSMQAGEQYQASVTVRNTGSNTWTFGAYQLGAKNPSGNTNWGTARVNLGSNETVATGQTKTFTWSFAAPPSAGTYNFQWRMLNVGIEWFGELTPNVVVTVQGSSGVPNDAQFVSQSVPSTMQAGQQYSVSLTMRNTGANTWTAAGYKLGVQNPPGNLNWGMRRVDLSGGDNIGTGQEKTFTWTVTAPSAAGTYDFQWRMLNVGVEWFGELTQNVVVTVQGGGPPLVNGAQFVSQSVPSQMEAGAQAQVSLTMQNTGTTTWTPGSYQLGVQNPPGNLNWGMRRVDLNGGDSIAPGQQKTFTWTITAPAASGTFNFQWRMLNVAIEWFGDQSANAVVDVTGGGALPGNEAEFVSQSVPSVMQAGQSVQVSVTLRNTGGNAWTRPSYKLGVQNPPGNTTWGMNRVDLSASDNIGTNETKTFTWTVTAPSSPGTYDFQWRMLNVGIEWFGERTTNVPVVVQ